MIGPNLSEWALSKRSLVVFLMIISVIAGTLSFLKLGRAEDPVFTFRTMVVVAAWPGATVDETTSQVTERLERTLQETHHLERVRSYTTAGQTTIFVDLKQSTPASEVPDTWYQVRKNIGDIRQTLPAGVVGPFFNDDFGDTFGIIYAFTADGYSFRELRDRVEAIRSRLLLVPDVSKIEVLGAQDEQIYIEFSTERLAGLRLDYPTIVAALQAQNVIRPAGVLHTSQERVFMRVSGSFDSEQDIANVNLVLGGRIIRLGDIATVRRGYADPPQPMFRVQELLERWGTKPLAEVLAPAIALAEEGFPIGLRHARMLGIWHRMGIAARFPETAAIQLAPAPRARARAGGSCSPSSRATLRAIAREGPRRRSTAARSPRRSPTRCSARGGLLTREDLAGYQRRSCASRCAARYRGLEVVSFPPPSSGGVALIETLNILEGFDLARARRGLVGERSTSSPRR